jgi:hypothetical protein
MVICFFKLRNTTFINVSFINAFLTRRLLTSRFFSFVGSIWTGYLTTFRRYYFEIVVFFIVFNETFINVSFFLFCRFLRRVFQHWTRFSTAFRRYILRNYRFFLIVFNETFTNVSFFYFVGSLDAFFNIGSIFQRHFEGITSKLPFFYCL